MKISLLSTSKFHFHIQNKYLEKTWDWPNKNFIILFFLDIKDNQIKSFWNKRVKR